MKSSPTGARLPCSPERFGVGERRVPSPRRPLAVCRLFTHRTYATNGEVANARRTGPPETAGRVRRRLPEAEADGDGGTRQSAVACKEPSAGSWPWPRGDTRARVGDKRVALRQSTIAGVSSLVFNNQVHTDATCITVTGLSKSL
jgi:hypothetical protein